MKKSLLLLFVLVNCQLSIVNSQSKIGNWCGMDYFMQQQIQKNPALQQELQQWRENMRTAAGKMELQKSSTGANYIVPTVVHVVYYNGVGNISDAQVKDGIRVMTEDYLRLNADSVLTRPVFKPYAASTGFEFRLAQIDPNGNPTNGITRNNSPLTNNADDGVKAVSYWNSSKYFNIWIVNSIQNSGSGTILGYAQFPGWGNWNTYGLVMLNTEFGRFGTSSSDGRTATHESGHCFGLYHTFEGACGTGCANSGDDVCDTPPTDHDTYGCDYTQNLCSNDVGGQSPYTTDVDDQIENFMSYDGCQNMFSGMQKTRMNASIDNIAQLTNLVSDANLTATGVNVLYATDFSANSNVVCVNQTVKFTDDSYYGQNGWSWSFSGGAPASSTIQSPDVIYYTPGLYDVSLTATNGTTTLSKVKSNYILVVNSAQNFLPFSEGFESGPVPNTRWYVANLDNDANTFQQITGVGYSGNACVKMNNIGNTGGHRDELIAGSFDFSMMTSVTMKFKAAYAQKDTSTKDKLIVYVSADCGSTWAPRYSKIGSLLASAPAQTAAFTPADTTQWKQHSLTLTSAQFKDNVLIKFVFESDSGNNFYLDDINITGTYSAIPILSLPLNNATGQSDTTTIDWKAVGGVDFYEYQMDTTGNFNSSLFVSGVKTYISTDPNNSDTKQLFNNLIHSQKYYWRVRTITGVDTSAWSAVWNFTVSPNGVGVNGYKIQDTGFRIYPNPVTGTSVVSFRLREAGAVSLEVFDIMGRKVSTIANKQMLSGGENQFTIYKNDFSQGLYFIRFSSPENTVVKKFVVE